MTQSENNSGNRKRRRPYNKRRKGNNNPNRKRNEQNVEKNGNVLEPSQNDNFNTVDDQRQLLPQSVTISASDYTQACQEAMMKLNIHDESLLDHEIIEKGKRNFLGILGSREITYKFFIAQKYDLMAQGFMEELVKLSFLDVSFDVTQEENFLKIDFQGEDEEILKNNGFELLVSLEQITRKFLIKKAALRPGFKIKFSVAGEVSTKEAKLEALAARMKEKAIKSKKIVTLNSMPPKDRRIIHQYFSEDDEIETKSHGESYYKRIKLVPHNLEKRPRKEASENEVADTESSHAEVETSEANGNIASEKETSAE
jgi:spoIIIJ-associated protein